MRAHRVRTTSAILAALAAAACAGRGGSAAESAPAPANGGTSAAEIEALYRARQDSARMRYTEADVRFVSAMIAHHAQAIEMARLAPTRGASPAVRTLAGRIVNAQRDEIATMQRWLRDRGQPVPELHETDAGVMVHGTDHAARMPGMITPEQMRELGAARGAAFDRLFLSRMIGHHQGAVSMVRALFATDGAGQDEEVFKLASDVQVDQLTEIARMEGMLASLPTRTGAP
jgi:uncharacterized protein (DUF305 family)